MELETKMLRDMTNIGIDEAFQVAVEFDVDFLGDKGREFRERIESMPQDRIKVKYKYIEAVIDSALDEPGGKDRLETMMDNKIVDLVNQMTPAEKQMMADFNAAVAERVYYGVREEPVKGTEAWCGWSNAWETWTCRELHTHDKEAGVSRLDANELLVDADARVLNKFKFLMKPLPLYEFSYEAGQRHGVDKHQQTLDWAFRQLESKDVAESKLPDEWR